MSAARSWTTVAAATAFLQPVAGLAQQEDAAIASVLRECRKIEALAARVACYDNIPIAAPSMAETPTGRAGVTISAAPVAARAPGFGANQLPRELSEREKGPSRIAASVVDVASLGPGIYILTLADGAQWQFIDPVGPSYGAPSRGARVEIAAAALGSYLMTFDSQRAVRIRRVR